MKKVFLSLLAIGSLTFGAQAQTEMGSSFVEINTGFGQGMNGTALNFTSYDGNTEFNIGGEGGYFIQDDLAIKVGLGFGSEKSDGADESFTTFGYKLGAKYFIQESLPVEVSLNGASYKDFDENPLWLGLQGGYAFWLADNIALEPGVRYNLSLNEDYADKGLFQGNIGFGYYFN